jgi:hypothetical protein
VQVGDGLYATTNYNGRSRLGFTLHCGNLACLVNLMKYGDLFKIFSFFPLKNFTRHFLPLLSSNSLLIKKEEGCYGPSI